LPILIAGGAGMQVKCINDDMYHIKQVDRDLSQKYAVSGAVFCDVGGAGGTDSFNFVSSGAWGVCIDIENVELSEGLRETERRGARDRLFFVKASATDLPFQTDVFDFLTSFSTIDHIPSKSEAHKAIGEFARVTKREGHVIVTIPNKLFLPGLLMMKIKSLTRRKYQREDYYYWNCFSLKELAQTCAKSELIILKYKSKYPLVVGPDIIEMNLPKILSKLPKSVFNSAIKVAIIFFRLMEKWGPIEMGARAGFDAQKLNVYAPHSGTKSIDFMAPALCHQ
jgi:ubiquinone/menaquinone biosynthesis C-methylase UbiE